ncbi:hypothetical protein CEXT_661801 [Caerostris extrusa]|uniref:Uncharacterized protein n=1 Tax=Caerostris extrusa TaxID=172846 RepID=A0AAV4Q329_CAEEX|nr:hypothetical protein CEXT_661801 [Caerostris extrusa]
MKEESFPFISRPGRPPKRVSMVSMTSGVTTSGLVKKSRMESDYHGYENGHITAPCTRELAPERWEATLQDMKTSVTFGALEIKLSHHHLHTPTPPTPAICCSFGFRKAPLCWGPLFPFTVKLSSYCINQSCGPDNHDGLGPVNVVLCF